MSLSLVVLLLIPSFIRSFVYLIVRSLARSFSFVCLLTFLPFVWSFFSFRFLLVFSVRLSLCFVFVQFFERNLTTLKSHRKSTSSQLYAVRRSGWNGSFFLPRIGTHFIQIFRYIFKGFFWVLSFCNVFVRSKTLVHSVRLIAIE